MAASITVNYNTSTVLGQSNVLSSLNMYSRKPNVFNVLHRNSVTALSPEKNQTDRATTTRRRIYFDSFDTILECSDG